MTATTQPLQALALANETRSTIAEFRRQVRANGTEQGLRMVSRVIEHDHADRIFGTAKVGHLMRAIPAVGEDKVYRVLRDAGVPSADKRLKSMTPRQRAQVIEGMEGLLDRWQANRARVERRNRASA